jgi:hypothetical protein
MPAAARAAVLRNGSEGLTPSAADAPKKAVGSDSRPTVRGDIDYFLAAMDRR